VCIARGIEAEPPALHEVQAGDGADSPTRASAGGASPRPTSEAARPNHFVKSASRKNKKQVENNMNIVKNIALTLALGTTVAATVQAQDARFSQYYAAPMRINPAMTGAFKGTWRLAGNYRTQWGAILGKAYNTYSFNADYRMPIGQNDFLGLGFSATSDKAGSTGYGQTDIYLSASYVKRLSKTRRRYGANQTESFLVAGGQIGLGQRGVRWSELTYSTQYVVDDNDYNSAIYSGESFNVRSNKLYADANLGLLWYATFSKRRSVYVGGSLYHINRPDISLFNDPPRDTAGNIIGTQVERMYRRGVLHAGGEIQIGGPSSPISLLPGVVAMFQGPSMEINTGLSMRYQQSKYDDFAFRVGIWNRLSNRVALTGATTDSKIGADALTFLIGLDYQNIQFGFSYDATISSLGQQINGRGGMEFSFIYIYDSDVKRQQGCPAFN
jgi:type IX secretion system PorP/SprF family membrane protein